MPSMALGSEGMSLKGREIRVRTSVKSSLLQYPPAAFSLLKLARREEGPSHRTPLTTSLCTPAR